MNQSIRIVSLDPHEDCWLEIVVDGAVIANVKVGIADEGVVADIWGTQWDEGPVESTWATFGELQ